MAVPLVPLTIGEGTAADLNMDDLTTGSLNGTGAFDVIMKAVSLHVTNEFNKGRITGKEYATVYLGLVSAALQTSIAYLTIGKEVEKLNADIALTRQKIVTELAQTSDNIPAGLGFNDETVLEGMLSEQKDLIAAQIAEMVSREALVDAQVLHTTAQTALAEAQTALTSAEQSKIAPLNLLVAAQTANEEAKTALTEAETTAIPAKLALLQAQADAEAAKAVLYPAQVTLTEAQAAAETAKTNTLLPKQVSLIDKQMLQTDAQTANTEAQTAIIPIQGQLYTAQKDGFARDAEQKLVKILVDTWSARRMTDEGTVWDNTNMLSDASIGAVVTKAKQGIGAA